MTDQRDGPGPIRYTMTLSQAETRFLKLVLKTAGEEDVDIAVAAEKYEEHWGIPFTFGGGTDEFYADPPTPVELLRNLDGQQWTGTRTDYEALQTALTMFVHDAAQAGQPVHEMHDTIEGIQTKIRRAYAAVGGDTVGPDDHPLTSTPR